MGRWSSDYVERGVLRYRHRVGRPLCMIMCSGLGVFLLTVAFFVLFSETTKDPCVHAVEPVLPTVAGSTPSSSIGAGSGAGEIAALAPAQMADVDCHQEPPGGTSSWGWFAFGGAVLLLGIGIGGFRGGCKYETVEIDTRPSDHWTVTIGRYAWRWVMLRETKHVVSVNSEARRVDCEDTGGLCAGAVVKGKVIVIRDPAQAGEGEEDVDLDDPENGGSILQCWNGTPLTLNESARLEFEINRFLHPERKVERASVLIGADVWKGSELPKPEPPARPSVQQQQQQQQQEAAYLHHTHSGWSASQRPGRAGVEEAAAWSPRLDAGAAAAGGGTVGEGWRGGGATGSDGASPTASPSILLDSDAALEAKVRHLEVELARTKSQLEEAGTGVGGGAPARANRLRQAPQGSVASAKASLLTALSSPQPQPSPQPPMALQPQDGGLSHSGKLPPPQPPAAAAAPPPPEAGTPPRSRTPPRTGAGSRRHGVHEAAAQPKAQPTPGGQETVATSVGKDPPALAQERLADKGGASASTRQNNLDVEESAAAAIEDGGAAKAPAVKRSGREEAVEAARQQRKQARQQRRQKKKKADLDSRAPPLQPAPAPAPVASVDDVKARLQAALAARAQQSATRRTQNI